MESNENLVLNRRFSLNLSDGFPSLVIIEAGSRDHSSPTGCRVVGAASSRATRVTVARAWGDAGGWIQDRPQNI